MQSWPDLRDTLQGIDWMIVGGVATRAYMPERATQDINILILSKDAEQVSTQLKSAGWKPISELSIGGLVFQSPDGLQLDVLFGDEVWFDEALRTKQSDPAGYPVIGLPYLVLMKLNSSRLVDLGDVGKMLAWSDEAVVNNVRQVVKRWSPADTDDLESIIYLGRLERGDQTN